MWLYGQKPIKVSHHPAKLGGYRHSGSFSFSWFWRDDITSTYLITFTEVNFSICTSLPNSVVIGVIVIEISILTPIVTWIPQKKVELTASIRHIERFSKPGIPIYNSSLGQGWQKNDKMWRNNTGNCKTLCVSHKRNIPYVCLLHETFGQRLRRMV